MCVCVCVRVCVCVCVCGDVKHLLDKPVTSTVSDIRCHMAKHHIAPPSALGIKTDLTLPVPHAKHQPQIRELVQAAQERAKQVLMSHKSELHKLAKALIEHDTLTGQEIVELLGVHNRKK